MWPRLGGNTAYMLRIYTRTARCTVLCGRERSFERVCRLGWSIALRPGIKYSKRTELFNYVPEHFEGLGTTEKVKKQVE